MDEDEGRGFVRLSEVVAGRPSVQAMEAYMARARHNAVPCGACGEYVDNHIHTEIDGCMLCGEFHHRYTMRDWGDPRR